MGRGETDVPVVLGGATVNPGDVVAVDLDGAVVLDPWRIEQNHF